MEGPGGYQLIGRTVPIWSGHRQRPPFEAGIPWLLRFFDRIRWYPVGAEELLDQRAAFAAGRLDVEVTHERFALSEHLDFLAANAASIAAFTEGQQRAFAAERDAWQAAGEFDAPEAPQPGEPDRTVEVPPGATLVEAPMAASVWRVEVEPGDHVEAGYPLLSLEAMKLEMPITAPVAGRILSVCVASGQQVAPGGALVVIGRTP
jgi:urea carboxylase